MKRFFGFLLMFSLVACSQPATEKPPTPPPEIVPPTGAQLFQNKGCYGCHGTYGAYCPSLANFSEKPLIAGKVPNTIENLRKWLKNPSSIKAGTRMPNLGLSDEEIELLIEYIQSL
jgi:cytochrome c oxidase subunit 2